MPVRSRVLFGPTVAGNAWVLLYTVPAGRTAVVRTITIYKSGGNTRDPVALAVNGGDLNHCIYRVEYEQGRSTVSVPSVAGWISHPNPPWDSIELGPGDTLWSNVGAGSIVVTGFGSLLEGVPT